MSIVEIHGRIYDAVLDVNSEPIELTRYDQTFKTSITLCFDNTSARLISDEVLERLKKLYLNSLM